MSPVIRLHASAAKHGVRPEDALLVARNPIWAEPLESFDPPCRELRLGFDSNARLLEVVVLIFDSGNELIIHAMKARTKYERYLF